MKACYVRRRVDREGKGGGARRYGKVDADVVLWMVAGCHCLFGMGRVGAALRGSCWPRFCQNSRSLWSEDYARDNALWKVRGRRHTLLLVYCTYLFIHHQTRSIRLVSRLPHLLHQLKSLHELCTASPVLIPLVLCSKARACKLLF
jgi:hypothetical protein